MPTWLGPALDRANARSVSPIFSTSFSYKKFLGRRHSSDFLDILPQRVQLHLVGVPRCILYGTKAQQYNIFDTLLGIWELLFLEIHEPC